MALIECPECGHAVSDQADSCPNCGHPMRQANAPERNLTWVRTFSLLTIAGGVLVAFGSLLPWRTASFPLGGTISVAGIEGDGVLTLVFGVVVGALGFVIAIRDGSRIASVFAVIAAFAGSIVTLFAWLSAEEAVDAVEASGLSTASIGIGLWVVGLGVAASLIGSIGSLASDLGISSGTVEG